ncbi:MAG: uroporphyrinogen-III synthase [Alteromonadaceae bacterium]|jgi:uroporphyrinogen-III synthase
MDILITRPRGKGEGLVRLLEPLVNAVHYQPVIDITDGPDYARLAYLADNQRVDILVFISGSAVDYFIRADSNARISHLIQTAELICVGQSTADRLQVWTNKKVLIPVLETSEGLLALELLQSEQVKGKNIVIVRGVGGRELLAEQLQSRGAHVTYWQLYQRLTIDSQGEQWFAQWQLQKINCIVITSAQILDVVLTSLPAEAKDWLQGIIWVVASQRIGEAAQQWGIAANKIINANGAGDSAVVAQIKQLIEK